MGRCHGILDSKDTSAGSGLSLHIVGASQLTAENQAHFLGWLEDGHPSPQTLHPLVPRVDTDPRLLSNAALGPIPLDHHLAQVQQEDVTPIKAVPRELHLPESGAAGQETGCYTTSTRGEGHCNLHCLRECIKLWPTAYLWDQYCGTQTHVCVTI